MFATEIFDEIFEIIATSKDGVRKILESKDIFPSFSTFFKYLSENKELSDKYARAKELQAEILEGELLAIADEVSNDTIYTEKGDAIPNNEWMQRSRLRIDTRKWLMSKLLPKKYGEKIQTELSGAIKTDNGIDLSKYSEGELAALIELQSKGRVSAP